MGARLNWLAVESADTSELLTRLGLAARGIASEESGAPLACAEFPGGWLVLVSTDMGLDLDRMSASASAESLVLACEIEEHVMVSRLRGFRGGAQVWSITHDPDVDPHGASVEGEPPPFADLRATLAAEQAKDADGEVDYMFDLPVRLGQRLCGYAHDEIMPVVWTILEPARRKQEAAPPPRLPEVFGSEILPRLAASGWTLASQNPAIRGRRAWDVVRVANGRLEALAFHFRENGADLQFETSFVMLDGPTPGGKVVRAGETRPVRPAPAAGAGGSLWRRIADRFRTEPAEPSALTPAPTDPLAELVLRVQEDLAAVEAFLSSGERSPRLQINRDVD
jgi:hypothetical protein